MNVSAAGDLRASLQEGTSLAGCFVKLGETEVIDVVAASGFDFALIDFEHSQLTEGRARRLVAHAHAIGLPAVVRMNDLSVSSINRFLEAGASGIQLSMLRSSDQRDRLVAATRYSPHGTRSLSTSHPVAGYGSVPLREYLEAQAAKPPLLVGQIETATTDDPMEEIVDGLDVVFAGTADLSTDMGHPGNLTHPEVRRRLEEMAAAARAVGAAFGGFVASPAGLPVLTDGGATYVVVGGDLPLLRSSLGAVADEVRRGLELLHPKPKQGGSRIVNNL